MAKYTLTNKAVQDLSEIWNYTVDAWSERQADRYYELLISAFAAIAEKPRSGKKYSDLAPGIYGQRVGQHIIFYHIVTANLVEVVRILHQRMDLQRRLEE